MKRLNVFNRPDLELYVSECDFEILSRFNWISMKGSISSWNGYKHIPIQYKVAELMGLVIPIGCIIDHKDVNYLNNTRENLRAATKQQNYANQKLRSTNKNGYVGIAKRNDKWQASINHNGKRLYLGVWSTMEAAAKAYDKKSYELHGEFAQLNFPSDYNDKSKVGVI